MVRFPDQKRPANMTAEEKLAHRRRLGRAASARYYAKHREALNAKKKEKYAGADKTLIKQRGKDYYLANKERIKARCLANYYKKKVQQVTDSDKKMSIDNKE
jgi:hypothetical protein